MRPLITVSAVVILHLCVLAVLVVVNGCRSTSGHEVESPADLAAFSGGLRRAPLPTKPGSAPAASAVVVPPAPAPAVPNLPTPPPAPVVSDVKVAPGETITVLKGEGMFAVARRQGIPVQELAAANGLPINAQLREGQRIKIPSGVKPASAPAPKSAPKSAPKAAPKAAPAAPTPQFEPLQLRPLGAPAAAKPAPAAEPAPAPAPAPKAAN